MTVACYHVWTCQHLVKKGLSVDALSSKIHSDLNALVADLSVSETFSGEEVHTGSKVRYESFKDDTKQVKSK